MTEDMMDSDVTPQEDDTAPVSDSLDEAPVDDIDEYLAEAIPRKPSTLLLLSALHSELKPTIGKLGLTQCAGNEDEVYSGQKGHLKIIAAVTGVGGARATAAFYRLVNTHKPSLVINLGFAGGLHPDLQSGEVLYFPCLMNNKNELIHFVENVPQLLGHTDIMRSSRKTLLTMEHVVTDPREKKNLHEKYGTCAVDMESFAIAKAAAEIELKLVMMRAISDTAADPLPASIGTWVKPDGKPHIASVLKYLLRHPMEIRTLLYLNRTTQLAGKKLAEKIRTMVGTVKHS